MTTTTANFPLLPDPTESFEFRAFILLDLIVARVKLRAVIELARLSFLGFYDRLEKFVDQLQRAEDDAVGEAAVKAIVEQRLRLATNVERLLSRLEPMAQVPFKRSSLGDYIAGIDRIEVLKAFIRIAKAEEAAEDLIERSKTEFLSEFARRRLTKHQRDLLIEKHRKFSAIQ
jgi:hypothetical protein